MLTLLCLWVSVFVVECLAATLSSVLPVFSRKKLELNKRVHVAAASRAILQVPECLSMWEWANWARETWKCNFLDGWWHLQMWKHQTERQEATTIQSLFREKRLRYIINTMNTINTCHAYNLMSSSIINKLDVLHVSVFHPIVTKTINTRQQHHHFVYSSYPWTSASCLFCFPLFLGGGEFMDS